MEENKHIPLLYLFIILELRVILVQISQALTRYMFNFKHMSSSVGLLEVKHMDKCMQNWDLKLVLTEAD